MNDKIRLDESSEEFSSIKKGWEEKASSMKLDDLPEFLRSLTEDYQHDYGTICHAMAVAATAAAWAMNAAPQGGVTGFQAGAVMWEFIRSWSYSGNKTGLRLIDYDNFLYPQYEDKFDKTLSNDIWEGIKNQAAKNIEEADSDYEKYLADSEQYEIDIAAFLEKYPDYYERREHYDPLGMGTGEQWEAEERKKASGFEFAPQAPHNYVYGGQAYKHWKSIISGTIPFGYKLENP